ncbi:hypothetical protein BCR32DRAFT_291305 [Anaeromyces robustus]|uniref:Calcineurin-like phosphoesterase domain-containing protein n=1 Tax=Anaeromyces robustus TaxID=1754192 RepID=A0A1Y1XFK3_9FUNG|nr:hypothetical protein BCR32DRAFT_291305 [Anaeromyces robustus]|eukprot:ORX84497.1 hypothetical protein BCR32DRAFT_291305 [Anaeromyces robustus]
MKINKINILSTLCFAINQISQSNAQASSQNQTQSISQTQTQPQSISQAKGSITDEQLNSFKFGSPQFRLAIIGDSGSESRAKKPMGLSTYDALLHLGDFDYSCKPDAYFENILPSSRSFEFMGILGNHEGASECGDDGHAKFKSNVYHEMEKNKEAKCEFSSSRCMWVCIYKNMRILGLTAGVNGCDKRDVQLSFLKSHLEGATEDWKICAWHFYDKYFHTGKYPDDGNIVSGSGESFYDYCRKQGAIIFSAHDHVYARTRVMSQFSDPTIDKFDSKPDENIVQIREGATIDILNGAGGWEMYIEQGKHKDFEWWQKKYAKGSHNENEHKYGGLFCNFNVGGNSKKAYCEFLRVGSDEKPFDTFTIYKNASPGNVTYSQIDDEFINEKIKAYKIENNIVDETNNAVDGSVAKSMNTKDNSNNSNSGSKDNNNNGTLFTRKNITIGGSVCAALVVIGSGVLIFSKSNKKVTDDTKLEIKDRQPNEGYQFNAVNINGQNSYDDSFTLLPTPEVISPLPEQFSFYHSNSMKRDYGNYDRKLELESPTSYTTNDSIPLVNNKRYRDNNNYFPSSSSSRNKQYNNNKYDKYW